MRTLPHTEFGALLARAGISQAAFARLAGLTPRQVNNWARGRAAVPIWAGLLAAVLQDQSPDALTIMLEETAASTLMTAANTDTTGQIEMPPPRPDRPKPSLKR
jgi:transcriptional regulator with XRE-family HTH domain